MTDFELFQETFKKYQVLFGLTGYCVYFKEDKLESVFANVTINRIGQVATACLNKSLSAKEKPYKDIKRSAKHEAIHLLLGRVETLARERYCFAEDITEAVEEVVVKLESLIP